ncbi:MAG TPA: M48 family metalloprotease [Sphingomonas sp.]|uniref:M48 family metalloprotease n=1 Tax=Sphingomonas sp. TaxID=28214 RepID=UPI002ED97B2F
MRLLPRRHGLAFLLALAPVTHAPAQQAISAQDKAAGAKANPQLLAQYGGAMRGAPADYVTRVARRVAVQSGLSNTQGDFTIALLNTSEENAFAIPGGYVYVTRQLLALMNSEAQLASVLGHEVGHVAARHSTKRNNRSSIGSVLAAGVGLLTGSDLLGQAAGYGAQLYTLGYSRSQEYQADALGVRYITAAGYDPFAAAAMLDELDAETRLQAELAGRNANAVPSWARTHPNGPDRVEKAMALAEKTGRTPPSPDVQDVAFLRMLDGLPYDDDPAQGVVDGRRFRHPPLRIQFDAPAGYTITNGADAVTISGAGTTAAGQARFTALPAGTNLAADIDARFAAVAGGRTLSHDPVRTRRVNGIDIAEATASGSGATAGGQAVDVTMVTWRGDPKTALGFTLLTPSGTGIGPFEPLIDSLTRLTPNQAAAIRGKRVRIVTVKAGEGIDQIAPRMAYADHRRERFLALNGLADADRLRPGQLVKIIAAD